METTKIHFSTHIRLTVGIILPVKMLFYHQGNKGGRFITKKRKEQNLTQEQLAERLGISNKTISKWEPGVSHS